MQDIRRLNADEAMPHIHELAAVLHDCVAGGASVSFLHPFSPEEAVEFFESAIQEVAGGKRILLAAFRENELAGTVQILMATPPNQPHRAELAKMLVSRKHRGHGLAKALLSAAEEAARNEGKTLLNLDTVVGEAAETLYATNGWVRAGVIPNYALFPDGRLCDTAIFWKSLAPV